MGGAAICMEVFRIRVSEIQETANFSLISHGLPRGMIEHAMAQNPSSVVPLQRLKAARKYCYPLSARAGDRR